MNHCNYFIFLFMMPTYFAKVWQLDIRASALYSLLPWVAMVRGDALRLVACGASLTQLA